MGCLSSGTNEFVKHLYITSIYSVRSIVFVKAIMCVPDRIHLSQWTVHVTLPPHPTRSMDVRCPSANKQHTLQTITISTNIAQHDLKTPVPQW